MNLLELRESTASLLETLAARSDAQRAGGATTALEGLLRPWEELLGPDAWSLAHEAARNAAERGEERRARRLQHLCGLHWQLRALAASAGAMTALERHEQSAAIHGLLAGERLDAAQAARALRFEPSRDARSALAGRIDRHEAAAHGWRHGVLDGWRSAATRCGASSPAAAVQRWEGWDPAALAEEAGTFLAQTGAMYRDVLGWWLLRTTGLRIRSDDPALHDWAYAAGPPAWEGLFPRGDATAILTRVLRAGGLPATALQLLSPVANGRCDPWATRAGPPRVITARARGLRDWATLLSCAGEALHRAGVDPDAPIEDRHGGDPSVPLATGLLLAQLPAQPAFVRRVMDADAPPDLRRVWGLLQLHGARRSALQWRWHLRLLEHGADAEVVAQQQDEHHRELALAPSPELLWSHAHEPLQAARHLRAMAAEAQLATLLRDRFDDDWWRNPAAAPWLLAIMRPGGYPTMDEQLARCGGGAPMLTHAVERYEALLG